MELQINFYFVFFFNYFIILSDNWEQQLTEDDSDREFYYIIPNDNWEQQHNNI